MITQKELKSILNYNPDTGIFTWAIKPNRSIKIGDIAGSLEGRGYHRIMLNRKAYKTHRLAWLYVYGEFPLNEIDHIDQNKTNNKINNLRECSRGNNNCNILNRKNNKSGYKGVSWNKAKGKWISQIQSNKQKIFLGSFDCQKKAHIAYCEAANKYHGEFSSNG